ncbi:MAG: helix-turn-helix transcriptional regulator [Clostridiales bacterium]|nr:helix-turn-helix transcriptional regulator [Clostridiales bacterium]
MANEHICPCTVGCPLQKAMSAIGGRWKMSILCSLSNDGATRYNDIKRKMGSISNTMLAKSLKELEDLYIRVSEIFNISLDYLITGKMTKADTNLLKENMDDLICRLQSFRDSL